MYTTCALVFTKFKIDYAVCFCLISSSSATNGSCLLRPLLQNSAKCPRTFAGLHTVLCTHLMVGA